MNTETKPVGRPTVATPENIAKAEQYVNGEWQHRSYGPSAKGWKAIMPTVEDLALYLGISTDSINDRQEFSGILKQLKAMQASILMNGSLIGDLNPLMAKMVLSSKHGYVEKSAVEQDNKSSDGSMTPVVASPQMAADFMNYMKDKTSENPVE